MSIQTNALEESELGGSVVSSILGGSVDRLIHVVVGSSGRGVFGLDDDFLEILREDVLIETTAVAFNPRGDIYFTRFALTSVNKVDNCGALKWTFDLGTPGRGVALSSDGSKVYAVGASNGLWTGSAGPSDFRNLWVLNSTTGALIDSKQLGPDGLVLNDVVLDSGGNVIVAGVKQAGAATDPNVFKLSSTLSLIWDWFNDTGFGAQQQITALAVDSSDNVYAVGNHSDTWEGNDSTFQDVWKLSSGSGSVLATMLIGPPQFTGSGAFYILQGVDVDDAGGVYIVGQVTGFYPGAGATITSLAAGIDDIVTTITVTAPALKPGSFLITIDTEDMLVVSGGLTTTWLVSRGGSGTTPAAHSGGATITANDRLRDAFKATSSLGSLVWSFLASVPGGETGGSLSNVVTQPDGQRIYICGLETGTAPPRSVWQLDKDGLQELTFEVGAGFTRGLEVRENR